MEELKELISKCHNPDLVQPDESPNGNTIYHVYSDGEITEQKGGWAYLQRSERTLEFSVYGVYINPDIFPKTRVTDFKTFGYAIVTRDNAKLIRNAIEKLR